MKPALDFLRSLSLHNDREWFNAHKATYQESLGLFKHFIAELLSGLARFDPALSTLEPKDTIFRIYRDVRFSKNKDPYKTHFGAWIAEGGRKSTDAGYYIHLEPDGTFMAAGVHTPPSEQLKLIRQEILFNPEEYRSVFLSPEFDGKYDRYGEDTKLKKGPVGFPADFELIEELKYKHYIYSRNYSDQAVLRPDFPSVVISDCKGLSPVVRYLNHAMSFTGND